MPYRLLTRSEDSLLQLEMSEVTEGSVMDVSAETEVETTGQPLMTSTPQKISACPPQEATTTDWILDLVSLVHNVIRNV